MALKEGSWLAYCSRLEPSMVGDIEAIGALMEQARRGNLQHGITGFLCLEGGQVFQYLEGNAHTLRALFARIARDDRHASVQVLDEGELAERQFPDWSMRLVATAGSVDGGVAALMDLQAAIMQRGMHPFGTALPPGGRDYPAYCRRFVRQVADLYSTYEM